MQKLLLLGISQRTIRAVFTNNPYRCQNRKRLSANPTTVGDWLHLKHIEATLSQTEVAQQIGVTIRKVRAWEHDKLRPTDTEWQALSAILAMGTGIPKPNPAADHGVGNYAVKGSVSQRGER